MQLPPSISRVYLIESDDDDCEIFNEAFNEAFPEMQIECTDSCVGVIDKIQKFNPDLIFIDLHLPKIPGLECMKNITLVTSIKHIPVVVYSAWNKTSDVRNCIKQGAKIYFEKPTSYKKLLELLKLVIELNWQEPKKILPMHYRDGQSYPIVLS